MFRHMTVSIKFTSWVLIWIQRDPNLQLRQWRPLTDLIDSLSTHWQFSTIQHDFLSQNFACSLFSQRRAHFYCAWNKSHQNANHGLKEEMFHCDSQQQSTSQFHAKSQLRGIDRFGTADTRSWPRSGLSYQIRVEMMWTHFMFTVDCNLLDFDLLINLRNAGIRWIRSSVGTFFPLGLPGAFVLE